MIYVVDASFVVESLFTGAEAFLNRSPGANIHFAAPHLLDAEVGQVLRRYFLNNDLTEPELQDALRLYLSFRIARYEHMPLMVRSLQSKNNITFYDALYVSLAEALNAVFVTRDARLGSAIRKVSKIQVRDSLLTRAT